MSGEVNSSHAAGIDAYERGDFTGAEAAFRQALLSEPHRLRTRVSLGASLLGQGRWLQGFQLYDERRGDPELFKGAALPLLRRWRGEDPRGQSMLVMSEEGFGDQIMYARYAAFLANLGANVRWLCSPPLTRLFNECLPGVTAHPLDQDVQLNGVDWFCPSSALATGFRDVMPPAPYLRKPEPKSIGARIGVMGRGAVDTPNDANRSLPDDAVARLLALPGAVSLRPEDTGAADFYETARIIAGLELVICVDTSVAHVAGAMGVPVWILLPNRGQDWRWLRDREDSPLYPSARLWRQAEGEPWGRTVDRVIATLGQPAAATPSAARDHLSASFPPAPERPFRVRPIQPDPTPCKVCESPSPLFGVQDFSRSCEESNGVILPLTGVPIYYRRCERCFLMFTDAFDDWSDEDFAAHIYNGTYAAVDPEFEEKRPSENANFIAQTFANQKSDLSVLDYGGGNGRFAQRLLQAGFREAVTYDGFHPDHRERPARKFDLVTCFETIEHMPDPKKAAKDIAAFLADDGLLVLSTLVQPDDILKQRANWWYVGPRNGHITLFSKAALTELWGSLGYRVLFTKLPHLHLICRETPTFARHIIGG